MSSIEKEDKKLRQEFNNLSLDTDLDWGGGFEEKEEK